MWTRTESWPVYRQDEGLDRWTARTKRAARLRDYELEPDVLVVFPRWSRLTSVGDRYVVREWTTTLLALHRAHFAPVTISQLDLGEVELDGPRARWRGREVGTIVLPYFTTIADDQLDALLAFHAAGGNLVFTKPNYIFADPQGRASTHNRQAFESLFGIESAPEVRRFEEGQEILVGGSGYRAHRLPDDVSEWDDAYLDIPGGPVRVVRNATGGTAALVGCALGALVHGRDLHQVLSTDGIRLLDDIVSTMAPRSFDVLAEDGAQDYDVYGLVRRRGAERVLSVHRSHDRARVVHVGTTAVHLPAGRASDHPDVTGINAFVRHVDDAALIVHNPLPHRLTQIDLGQPIRRLTDMGGTRAHLLIDGSVLRCAVPSGRSMRFSSVEYGERDEALAADVKVDGAQLLEAWQQLGTSSVSLRVAGGERAVVRLSLPLGGGEQISARCTAGTDCVVSAQSGGGRLFVQVEASLLPTIENDIVVVQAES
jgi:hypothetical protein